MANLKHAVPVYWRRRIAVMNFARAANNCVRALISTAKDMMVIDFFLVLVRLKWRDVNEALKPVPRCDGKGREAPQSRGKAARA